LPLGGLRLNDMSGGSLEKAAEIARREIARTNWLSKGEGRAFYCVGGTWRNLARLHMIAVDYRLQVMHGYKLDPEEHAGFLKKIARGEVSDIKGANRISK